MTCGGRLSRPRSRRTTLWTAPCFLLLLLQMGTLRKATSLQVSHVLLLSSLHQRTRTLTETTKTTTRREKRFGTSSSRIMHTQVLAVTRFDSSIPDLSTTETVLQEIPHHLSHNDDKQHRQQAPPFLNWSDVRMVVLHLLSCVVVSLSLCAWEDYTVSFVPHDTAVPRRSHAILGMAYGQEGLKVMSWIADDQELLTTDDLMTDYHSLSIASPSPDMTTISTWPPRPYNDIMLEHRSEHVPRWTSTVTSEATVREATRNVYQALQAVDTMGRLADDYEWDQMRALLHAPVLRQTLEEACNALRTATTFLPPEARREIGFHWGSCAWRHCGAQADAQEALDELDMMLGVLEPFECQFVLDIVERSLRDILAVIPADLHPSLQEQQWRPTKDYQPYESPPPPALPDWLYEST